jgi:hypothetical protein
MLRTNLSTRPFYNDRAVRMVLFVALAAIVALTAFNLLEVMRLSARGNESAMQVAEAERQTAEHRRDAQQIRALLKSDEMAAVQNAAREANILIDRRVFSWTDLFNQFEQTLPSDVRITAVAPQVDNAGRLLISVTVLSRTPEDLNLFMDELEKSGRFRDVLNRQDTQANEGLTRSIVQGYYQPPTTTVMPASDSGVGTSNSSPADASTPDGPANRAPAAPETRP